MEAKFTTERAICLFLLTLLGFSFTAYNIGFRLASQKNPTENKPWTKEINLKNNKVFVDDKEWKFSSDQEIKTSLISESYFGKELLVTANVVASNKAKQRYGIRIESAISEDPKSGIPPSSAIVTEKLSGKIKLYYEYTDKWNLIDLRSIDLKIE